MMPEQASRDEAQKQADIMYQSERSLVKDARYIKRYQILSNPNSAIF